MVKDISKHGVPILETPDMRGKKTNKVSNPNEIHEFEEKITKNIAYGTQTHNIIFYKLKNDLGYIQGRDIARD